jgi:hypothetical protein
VADSIGVRTRPVVPFEEIENENCKCRNCA